MKLVILFLFNKILNRIKPAKMDKRNMKSVAIFMHHANDIKQLMTLKAEDKEKCQKLNKKKAILHERYKRYDEGNATLERWPIQVEGSIRENLETKKRRRDRLQ